MKFYADLHLHSHYSRATSKDLNLEHLSKWAQLKGIQLVGTADFVHPGWLAELQEKLEPAEPGFFKLKPAYARKTELEVPAACKGPVRFMLTVEISNIYKRLDRVRKIHNVVVAPSFAAAEKIQSRLEAIGNIRSDGRPILGLDSRDLLEIVLESDPLSFLIPAHIWTPWFAALGSKGGFDRIEECYGDLTPHVFAVETGLSSDPPMNWRLKQLDPYVLVSNSDAHSPAKLGREATIFNTEFSYPKLYSALADHRDNGLVGTVEFFPEEGKYHYDGHRNCKIRWHPRESAAHQGLCPKCGKPVVVGVMARVEELADRPENSPEKPPRWRPFYSLIPLPEIIGEAKGRGPATKGVQQLYMQLLSKLGNELYILQDAPLADIQKCGGGLLAEAIRRMRAGEVDIAAGYDGEYGSIKIFDDKERAELARQTAFFPDPTDRKADDVKPQAVSPQVDVAAADSAFVAAPAAKPAVRPSSPRMADVQLGGHLPADLNAAQWRAVTHSEGHLLIIAGPGTGKTHTLTWRIAHVAQCFTRSEQILAITFTNRAAAEMQERLRQRLGGEAEGLTVGTFHSFCLQLLRKHQRHTALPGAFSIAAPDEIEALARQVWGRESGTWKQNLEALSRWHAAGAGTPLPEHLEEFRRALRAAQRLDFDDLVTEALLLLRRESEVADQVRATHRFIFVDEYQDINGAQHALLRELVRDGVQLTAIGDPNQAIYGFRGAEVRSFQRFQEEFAPAKVLYLSENYRAAENLLLASGQVIRHNADAPLQPLTANFIAAGRLTVYDAPTEKAEAEYIVHQIEKMVGGTSMFSQDSGRVPSAGSAERSFGDIAVLYRLNSQRPVLEEAFSRSGIPYQVSGDRPLISQAGVKEFITTLQLANQARVSGDAAAALLRFLVPGLGEKTGARLKAAFEAAHPAVGMAEIQSLLRADGVAATVAAGIRRVIAEVQEAGGKLRKQGLVAALQHLIVFPSWQRKFAAVPKIRENWQRLLHLARRNSSLAAFLDSLLLQREDDMLDKQVEKVALLTLHASKGLEFPVVFIAGCEAQFLPLQREGAAVDPAEERRLFYVGMTRAREQLYLLRARKRLHLGRQLRPEPSPFLTDIEEELKAYDAVLRRRVKKAAGRPAQLDLFSGARPQ